MERDNSWRHYAKCKGEDPNLWDLEFLRAAGVFKQRRDMAERYAKRACAGCPVLVECAEAAYRDHDCFVIRAGIPLRIDSIRLDRAKLCAIFDPDEKEPEPPSELQRQRWKERRCRSCGSLLRPQRSYVGHWPNTKASACADICQSCWKREKQAM